MRVRRSIQLLSAITPLVTVTIALAGSSCGRPAGCDTVLGISYHPADTTIQVGQSFRPSLTLTSCGATKKLSPERRYSADDTKILQVTFSGVMTGRSVGHTMAYVSAADHGVVVPVDGTVRSGRDE